MKIIKKIINIILVLIPVVAIIYVGINAESISGIIDQKEKELKASTTTEYKIDESQWEYKGNIYNPQGYINMKSLYEHLDEHDSKYFYIKPIDDCNTKIYEVGNNQLEAVYRNMKDLPYSKHFSKGAPPRSEEIYDTSVVKELTAKSIQRSFDGSASDLRRYKTSGRAKEFIFTCRNEDCQYSGGYTELVEYYDINKLKVKCSNVNVPKIGVAENTCDMGGIYLLVGTMDIETLEAKDGFKGSNIIPKKGEKKTVRFIYSGRCINSFVKQMSFLSFNAGF